MAVSKPRNFDELFPGRFLKSGLLLDGRATYTISEVLIDEIEGDKGIQVKGIIKFREIKEELVLNKTNGVCLREMFGKQVQAWIGKRIALCQEKTKFGAETVDCIRIHGSPDLEREISVKIKHPKKAQFVMTMHRTGAQTAATTAPLQPNPPTVAEYETCADVAGFDALEVRRKEHWKHVPTADKPLVKAASEAAQKRLQQPRDFDQAASLLAIRQSCEAKDAPGLEAAWSAVFNHFESIEQEIPVDLEAAYHFAKESLAQ